jgi:hypothetical protein
MENVWVPIAVALLGNGMTLAVLLISTNSARANARAWQESEDGRIETARHDVRVQLARSQYEKLARLRQGPYVECFQEYRKAALVIHAAGYAQADLPIDWQLPAYEALLQLEVFAEWETRVAARAAYSALFHWGFTGPFNYESEQEQAFDAARDAFLVAIRHDLGIEVDDNRISEADVVR